MKKLSLLFTLLPLLSLAQVGIDRTNTHTPDASSELDVYSTSKGMLIPNVALTATNAAGPVTSPAVSLLVYNTATAGTAPNNVIPGYYYNSGTSGSPNWTRLQNQNLGNFSKVDPLFIRGTGLNNSVNRIVRIGSTEAVNTNTRGLTLTIITKSTHAIVSNTNYDTHGVGAQSDALATALNALSNSQIGILTSFDAWEGAITTNLKNAFQRLGLYKGLMTTVGGSRRPYAAIFEASSSSGVASASAVEIEHSNDGNQPYAEQRGWLIDGSFVATNQQPSGLSTPVGAFALGVDETGNIGVGNTAPAYKMHVTGDVYANGGFLRVSGNNGLYFENWGGGWNMTDATWIRSYNSKQVYISSFLRADGGIASGGLATLGAGTIHANGQVRAPSYYDYDDPTYYVDPATASVIRGTVTIHDNGAPSPLLDIRADDTSPWAIRLYNDAWGTGPQIYASATNIINTNGYWDGGAGLCIGGDCRTSWAAVGDNLGNHTATTTLNMAGNTISNAQAINSNGDHLELMTNRTDDNSYEWMGFYSGGTRQGIFLWDGAWSGANSLTNEFSLSAENNNKLTINTNNGDVALMPKAGNVGVGSLSPGARLDVQGGASGIRIGNGTYDANMVFGNNATWKSGIRVYDNGVAEMRIWHVNSSGKIFMSTGYNGDQSTALPTDGLVVHGNKVGIGSMVPGYKLDVNGDARLGQTWLSNSDIYFNNTGHNHSSLGNTNGYAAIENASNYNTLMILGRSNGIGGVRSVSIWDRLDINGDTYTTGSVRLGDATSDSHRFWGIIYSGGADDNHQINTGGGNYGYVGNSSYYWYQMFARYYNAANGYYYFSDRSIKENIKPIESALDKVLQLNGVTYDVKKESYLFNKKDPDENYGRIGFVAQDFQKVLPNAVKTIKEGEGAGLLTVEYTQAVPVMVEAIKEQQQMIEELKKQNELMKKEIEALKNK